MVQFLYGLSMNDKRIVIGHVKGPRGIRGEIRLRSATDISGRFDTGQIIYIESQMYEVLSSKVVGSEILVFLDGISDRNQVEDLSGKEITANYYDRGLLPPDTYFHYDLIGLEVRDEYGYVLGHISEVIETGANDVYVIHLDGERDILVPAISSVVTDVDIEKLCMVINLPDGLDTRNR